MESQARSKATAAKKSAAKKTVEEMSLERIEATAAKAGTDIIKQVSAATDAARALLQEVGSLQSAKEVLAEELSELHGKERLLLELSDLEGQRQKTVEEIATLVSSAKDAIRSEDEAAKTRRDRDEEEYRYSLKVTRREEELQLNETRRQAQVSFEATMSQREAAVEDLRVAGKKMRAEAEELLKEAQRKNAEADARVETAVSAAVSEVTQGLHIRYGGEAKDLRHQISMLEAKLASKETEIDAMDEQLAKAEKALEVERTRANELSQAAFRAAEGKAVTDAVQSALNSVGKGGR